MNILCIGDVVGSAGCDILRSHLPSLKKIKAIDLCIVNGENAADGNGITPFAAKHLYDSGADVITGGNHTFRNYKIHEMLDIDPFLIRPYNYPKSAYGCGISIVDKGSLTVAVINMIGVVFMENMDDPFGSLDTAIYEAKAADVDIIIVDFHAEATAEKRACAFYVDGRVSAFFGTHTHVLTADETVLPQGTGYITDIGMTGPINSVLGIKPELAIAKQKDKMPVRFQTADGPCMINGCIFYIDDKTGLCTGAERISIQ